MEGARGKITIALHQSGHVEEARKTLADAVRSYDWSAAKVRARNDWISHLRRREAERLIMPALPEGK